ncbi:MAG TPA: type I methionyl aminopeptidase [Candidatus Marinimicrobia bacterium]|jgi:methionyl aminopeptidase|nr:type I methionyl aminopeptidase [Candidatus Neomarinimicrobiota bacterium]
MVAIRSKREVEKIAESSRIVADSLDFLEDKIVEGVTGMELDKIAEDYIRSRDAEPAFKGYMGYPATLCISVNDEVVHGIPNDTSFKNGDIVGIDCGALKDGYYGDHARTYMIGNVSQELQDLVNTTRKSLKIGIDQAKAGNYVSDIGHAIQTYVEEKGYSVVRELVGHGIGRNLHEDPQIPNYGEPGRGLKLKSGMCIAIEPMINLGGKEIYTKPDGWTICTQDGKPSAHFEHTIVITEQGGNILSNGTFPG